MTTRLLLFPETVRVSLNKRYHNQHRHWLGDRGEWPLIITLGCPTEREANRQSDVVRTWIKAWETLPKHLGEVNWCTRAWQTLGTQRIPERLILNQPEIVAEWIGKTPQWRTAQSRYTLLVDRWPALAPFLPRYFEVLAEYNDEDYQRLENIISWLEENPSSNLYPRQLPIKGIDSKWLEKRKTLITDWLSVLKPLAGDENLDFHQRCGLKKMPHLIRLKILDPVLRKALKGLSFFSASFEELACLNLKIECAYIVENLQTGLAFNDLPGSIVIMGLGYHVEGLASLPWLCQTDCVYWGDIDTHGFAILNRARSYFPNLKSILMDEDTLQSHRALWGNEKVQHGSETLELLTSHEQKVYSGLKEQCWGNNVRLEQERIDWDYAWRVLLS